MRYIPRLGLTKGILGGVIGALIGGLLTVAVRAAVGMTPYDEPPVFAIGSVTFLLGFLTGAGAFADWGKQARGLSTPAHPPYDEDAPGWTRYFNFDGNHKIIGVQYAVTSILLMLIGGSFALLFRTELAQPGLQFLVENDYNTFMSLHGIVMIAGILVGVGAMGNYLVPLMIGAQDMAFPRLNALSYWLLPQGAIILLGSLLIGGFDTGWTGYPPLSAHANLGMQFFFLGVYIVGLSSIVGSINMIVTIVMMRAPGMTLWRMPIFVWAMLATSLLQFTATQFIGLAFLMVTLQRLLGMGFFDPAAGGNPILFQHLFWFYSHPAVYVFVLPGLGVISELLPVFARKPLFGYKWIAMSSLGIALVGFLVWAHHMFVSGMNQYLQVPFMYSTLLVAVPTGVKFFSWVATIWKGKIETPTPMLFVIGGIVVFLLGGLSGPPNATVSTDLHLHDTYFIVGHFHDTLFGGYVFPFFAAIYYWFPKATGRRMNEFWGKVHFWLMTPAFLTLSLLMMRVGLLGMRRRIVDYDPALGLDPYHLITTVAAFLIALSILIFLINFFRSIQHGEKAEGNVWNSRSPEWQVPSPMPVHNYDKPFEVVGEPYDYGLPGSAYVQVVKSK